MQTCIWLHKPYSQRTHEHMPVNFSILMGYACRHEHLCVRKYIDIGLCVCTHTCSVHTLALGLPSFTQEPTCTRHPQAHMPTPAQRGRAASVAGEIKGSCSLCIFKEPLLLPCCSWLSPLPSQSPTLGNASNSQLYPRGKHLGSNHFFPQARVSVCL